MIDRENKDVMYSLWLLAFCAGLQKDKGHGELIRRCFIDRHPEIDLRPNHFAYLFEVVNRARKRPQFVRTLDHAWQRRAIQGVAKAVQEPST